MGARAGLLAVVDHNRGSAADPDQIRHHYTLLHTAGPWVLVFLGSPVVIALILGVLLARRRERGGLDRTVWTLAVLSCLICLLGLIVEGIVMVPTAVLIVWAVASAPRPVPSLHRR